MSVLEHTISSKSGDVEHSISLGDAHTIEPQEALSDHIRTTFDRRLMPVMCGLYILSFLDRGNIGNAKAAGTQKDLGLTDSQWSWVLNAFYICYVCFEWTTIMWKILPAHIYVSVLCVLWGAAAMCSGAAQNMAGLVVCRAFLGVFEAAFGAGAPYFLSMFYRRRELGFRVSLLLGMSPLANCFASALAYGIKHIRGSMEPWRYLFIIEGAPTVAYSVIAYHFLPDSPDTAKYLTEAERTHAIERLHMRDRTKKSGIKWSQVFDGLSDYQNYVHTAIHFCCNFSYAALSNFLPTILREMGYSSVNAQGLTAPVYFVAFLCCIASAVVGYLLLTLVRDGSQTGVRYAGIWFAACGIFPSLALNITWLLNNQGGDSKKGAGLAMLATLGQCSSFVSSTVFPDRDAPFYTKGCAIGCAFTGMIVILAMSLHFALERENKWRDRELGPADFNETLDVTEMGDKHRHFRYLT
ncbi:major facilitator superfamily domain-containing protein [Ilyonectria robusta]|uniref:major facilitator superfamily domain-containing protein n=1 Tax=Ilyonectria robusta TaxID=1079257 RepID=UPI001E8EAD19|nr:major facilitator superfamily domain-containing protein [Ilyonectria robusta]KAH8648832.1 major facilitator superfamily domain-containing protein [Ilyonectria robusta]